MRIRGGSGLGDAIYVRVVAEWYISRGYPVTACCNWPDLFIGSGCHVEGFSRSNIDCCAHYTQGKRMPHTTQWQDVCRMAGVPMDLPFRFEWKVQNKPRVHRALKAAHGRKLILVQGGKVPMARRDGFGKELLPEKEAFDEVLSHFTDCFLVQIGTGQLVYRPAHIEHAYTDTTIAELVDLFRVCDGVICQPGFAVPAAEVFDKPVFAVFAEQGLKCNNDFLNAITPKKLLSNPTREVHAVDTWDVGEIKDAANAFRALF